MRTRTPNEQQDAAPVATPTDTTDSAKEAGRRGGNAPARAAQPAWPIKPSVSRQLWHTADSLPTPEQVERLVARETARAERNGHPFSLALFRVKATRGPGRMGMTERRLALTLMRRARLTDEVGWFNDSHLCALLPDTSADGAKIFAESVCDLVARKGPRPISVVYTYPGEAKQPDDGDGDVGGNLPDDSNDGNDEPPGDGDNRRGGRNGNFVARDGFANAREREPALAGAAHRLGLGPDPVRAKANGHAHGKLNGHPAIHESGQSIDIPLSRGDLVPFFVQGAAHAAGAPDVATPAAARAHNSAEARPASGPTVQPMHELFTRPMPLWKRAIDVTCAGLGLLALSPLFAAVAVFIKVGSPGPVLFCQKRAGLGGRAFKIYKFRTMVINAEAQKAALRKFSEQDGPAFKMARDPRITGIGHLLRKTSLDELPQLWNVLKGDMSLVGPRPLPIDEAEGCERWQKRRLDVTPGLTCIWQISGRSEVSFAEWVRMDVSYMRRRTILHDLSILLRTVPAVLLRRGAK